MRLLAGMMGGLLIGVSSIAASDLPVPRQLPTTSENLVCSSAEEISTETDSVAPTVAEPPAIPNEKLERLTISNTRTSAPKQREWQEGKPVELARDHAWCAGRLVREWLRIRCFMPHVVGASLLGGDRDGTSLRMVGKFDEHSADSAEIVFPLRRGDRRVFQITALAENDLWGGAESLSAMISESWVDDDRGPIVVVGP
jgi:hypothetical protein